MYRFRFEISTLAVATACLAALAGSPAAAVTTVTSSAYGVSANLTLLGFLTAGLGPIGPVGSSTAPNYNLSNTVLSVNQTLSLGVPVAAAVRETAGTGVIMTAASATLPAGQASSVVNGLSTKLGTQVLTLPIADILSIGARTITATSSVSGAGPLSASGSSTLEGLTIGGSALGVITIDGAAFVNPAANTVLLDILGLRIVLNEQLTTGNGFTTLSETTNALHISFNNFLVGGGLLSGDVIVGHSAAAISADAVPEPAAWALMIAGFGMVGAASRHRRRYQTA